MWQFSCEMLVWQARCCATCRSAAALYILRCVPALLLPFGVLTSLLYLLLGFLLALGAAAAALVSRHAVHDVALNMRHMTVFARELTKILSAVHRHCALLVTCS